MVMCKSCLYQQAWLLEVTGGSCRQIVCDCIEEGDEDTYEPDDYEKAIISRWNISYEEKRKIATLADVDFARNMGQCRRCQWRQCWLFENEYQGFVKCNCLEDGEEDESRLNEEETALVDRWLGTIETHTHVEEGLATSGTQLSEWMPPNEPPVRDVTIDDGYDISLDSGEEYDFHLLAAIDSGEITTSWEKLEMDKVYRIVGNKINECKCYNPYTDNIDTVYTMRVGDDENGLQKLIVPVAFLEQFEAIDLPRGCRIYFKKVDPLSVVWEYKLRGWNY